MTDPARRQTIIEDLAAMTESEFLDTVAKARGGGGNNPQSLKETAAAALRRYVGGAPADSKE